MHTANYTKIHLKKVIPVLQNISCFFGRSIYIFQTLSHVILKFNGQQNLALSQLTLFLRAQSTDQDWVYIAGETNTVS